MGIFQPSRKEMLAYVLESMRRPIMARMLELQELANTAASKWVRCCREIETRRAMLLLEQKISDIKMRSLYDTVALLCNEPGIEARLTTGRDGTTTLNILNVNLGKDCDLQFDDDILHELQQAANQAHQERTDYEREARELKSKGDAGLKDIDNRMSVMVPPAARNLLDQAAELISEHVSVIVQTEINRQQRALPLNPTVTED
jgi:hypothetical protein